jgi:Asp-tRNA(Asn)/Glu-tRNA(Gln) amidotransferase A subunit family amidase
VGFDADDFMTRLAIGHVESHYEKYLDADALKTARIGVVVQLLGDKPEHADINRVFDEATKKMSDLGATVFPVMIPKLFDYQRSATDVYEAYDLLNKWFADLGPTAPYHSIEEFLAKATYNHEIVPRIMQQKKFGAPEYQQEYEQKLIEMAEFRKLLVATMDRYNLDALVYPLQKRLVSKHGEPNVERNGFLASNGMLPAIDVPAGYSRPTPEAPKGVPIGMDLLGRPFDEGRLLALAYAWEMNGWKRIDPPFTP